MPGGFTPPPGPARPGAEAERSEGSRAAAFVRAVLVPPLMATLVGLAFVVVFLDAFHAAGRRPPAGVAVRALRGATYFADDGVGRAVWVLLLWSVVPLALIGVVDAVARRRAERRGPDPEPPEPPGAGTPLTPSAELI